MQTLYKQRLMASDDYDDYQPKSRERAKAPFKFKVEGKIRPNQPKRFKRPRVITVA